MLLLSRRIIIRQCTISAASITISEPSAPIAMPISALESTGTSLIPSPTKAKCFILLFSSEAFRPQERPYLQDNSCNNICPITFPRHQQHAARSCKQQAPTLITTGLCSLRMFRQLYLIDYSLHMHKSIDTYTSVPVFFIYKELRRCCVYAILFHKLFISYKNLSAFYICTHIYPLLYYLSGYNVNINIIICIPYTLAYRMRRITFCICCQFKKFFFWYELW